MITARIDQTKGAHIQTQGSAVELFGDLMFIIGYMAAKIGEESGVDAEAVADQIIEDIHGVTYKASEIRQEKQSQAKRSTQ